MTMSRLILVCTALTFTACEARAPTEHVADADVAFAAHAFPTLIRLPNGFQPEGIAVGRGSSFFVGGLFGGAIYRGDLRTGAGGLLVPPQPDRSAVGMAVDSRSNLLFVAGGFFGTADVYDAATGASAEVYSLYSGAQPTLVNDVVITREAAYFTDSFRSFLYRLPLGPAGRLPDPAAVEEIPLSGDFMPSPGAPLGIGANGIVATPDGMQLIVVNTDLGTLYRVDPVTGVARLIDLGGASVPFADGLVLAGFDLYVVQNVLNQVAVVRLTADLAAGTITRIITDDRFRIPATADRFGSGLYVVNARFDVAPPTGPGDPNIEFEVVRVAM